MPIAKNKLAVKNSRVRDAGKGLFTKIFIPKGTDIVEYKGKIVSWGQVDADNPFIYYVKRNHVIDARPFTHAYARYANDALGISRVKGMANNAAYTENGLKVFITSTSNIPAGAEILVAYGKEYWDAIRHNIKQEKIKQQLSKRKKARK